MLRKTIVLILLATLLTITSTTETTTETSTETTSEAIPETTTDDDDLIIAVAPTESSEENDVTTAAPFDYYEEQKDNFPCSFLETINITDGIRNFDGSISHDGIRFSENHYKEYGYIYRDYEHKQTVKKHIRGCICLYKICIRSCCRNEEDFVNGTCIVEDNITLNTFNVSIHDTNGKINNHNLYDDDDYEVTYGAACHGTVLGPDAYENGKWFLERVSHNIIVLYD